MSTASEPTRSELETAVSSALELARQGGATQAEAGVSASTGLSVSVRLGEVETLEYQRDRGLGITVYVGTRKGSASTANLAGDAIAETVAKALSIARFTAADPFAGLPDATLLAADWPDLDLCHPWEIDAPAAIELARECEAAGRGSDPRIANSEGATVSTQRKLRVLGNSHGFLGGYPSTVHSISCVLLGQAGEDLQRDYWFTTARDWRRLEPPADVGRRAADRAVRRLGASRLATQRAPVLFAPELARGLIGALVAAASGTAQYRRSSFLLDAAGQRVLPEALALVERPHLPGALGSAPFDGEGVATRDRELVVAGVLQGYVLDAYAARKLGLATTGNAGGVHNLIVSGPALAPPELLARLGRGLLVTELMGQGINPVTGDYSRGAAGFWVEDGALVHPVHEVTIAGNLRDMYRDIVALGSDRDERGAIHCGSLLVGTMMIAGA